MNYPKIIKSFLDRLKSTTLQTFLAMLGILVGTASVVAMVSTGQMASEEALKQFKNLGIDLLSVSMSNKEYGPEQKTLSLEDALKIKNASPDISIVAPYIIHHSDINYKGTKLMGGIIGVTSDFANVIHLQVNSGRFISPFDRFVQYCVIGNGIYKQIKNLNDHLIGSRIYLGNTVFVIIGVLDAYPENAFLFQDINESVIVPIKTIGLIAPRFEINDIIMRLSSTDNIPAAKSELEKYLNFVAPNKKLFFRSSQELLNSMEGERQIFTLLLSLIGSISLIVGGIGVMNIMLVAVLERRREIGIRLALGARRKEIQWMFLSEAILLSLLGGVFGVIVGILSSLIIATFFNWEFTIFLLPPIIGFSVSVLIGIFFGFYPAYKAAKLDPIQTLRAE